MKDQAAAPAGKPSDDTIEVDMSPYALFRPPAVAHALGPTATDKLVLRIPFMAKMACAVALLLGVSFVALITLVRLPIVESMQGVVVSTLGVVRISPAMAGTIERIYVEEGAYVQAQDPLFEIRSGNVGNAEVGAGAQALDILRRQLDLVEAEYQSEKTKIETEAEYNLSTRIPQLMAIVESSDRQVALLAMNLDRSRAALARTQDLFAGGNTTQDRLIAAQSDVSQRELDLIGERSRRTQGQLEISNLQYQSDQANALIARARIVADQQISQLSREITSLRGEVIQTVRAPTAGRITTIGVTLGQAFNGSSEIALMVPEESKIMLEFPAMSRVVGLVDVGGNVRLSYASFPFQRFGIYDGKIASVSSTAVGQATASGGPGGGSSPVSVFQMRVQPDVSEIMVDGIARPLQPGMQVEGRVILYRKTILQWIFDPLISGLKRVGG